MQSQRPRVLKKPTFQIAISLLNCAYQIAFYSPVAYSADKLVNVLSVNASFNNSTTTDIAACLPNSTENDLDDGYPCKCGVADEHLASVISVMDSFNCLIVPFVCMFVFSMLTIHLVRVSRSRSFHVAHSGTENISMPVVASTSERRRANRDLMFAVQSISLNLLFLLLNFPLTIYVYLVGFGGFDYFLLSYILTINFSIQLPVSLLTNSVFRAELFRMLWLINTNTLMNSVNSRY